MRPKTRNAWAAIRPHAQTVIRRRPKSPRRTFRLPPSVARHSQQPNAGAMQRVRLKAEPNSGFSLRSLIVVTTGGER
jgi:hypothetical protein